MAHIYIRPKSRFYWISYRDAATGKVVRKSTGFPTGTPAGKAKAIALEAEMSAKERQIPGFNRSEKWEVWAEQYFRERYPNGGSTFINAMQALRDLLVFFKEHDIQVPRQVTYEVASRWAPWRVNSKTLGPIKASTAKLRFVYFSLLMAEAVRRGFAPANPCREVKIATNAPKVKPEITVDDQHLIEAALLDQKEWMTEQWLVLMRQGCRLMETKVPLDRIDEKRGTITFRVKGGKFHTAPLHPDLLSLVKLAREQKRKTLVEPPPSASMIWLTLFRNLGLPYSIHCTRVTVITRLLRAGHSVAKVAAFIGHTEEIQKVYRRLTPPDVHDLLATLGEPASPSM